MYYADIVCNLLESICIKIISSIIICFIKINSIFDITNYFEYMNAMSTKCK